MSEPRVSSSIPISARTLHEIQKEVAEQIAMQVESAEDLQDFFEESLFNPLLQARRFQELEKHRIPTKQDLEGKKAEEETKVLSPEEIEDTASRFQKQNDEMQAKTLLILRSRISAKDTPEETLDKVLSFYADPSLADEALDFLIKTADPSTLATVKRAKEILNETRGREIKAGRNMGVQSREFSKQGLGSPTSLRDMYRDITGNPREPLKLFDELAEKFRYEKLKPIITFLLHSLGSDLKSKGPSISRGELKRLIDDIRSLQGILGVYRFFQSRMHAMQQLFLHQGLIFPPRLDFEMLAKLFIRMLAERYMNPEKILQTARYLGIDEEVAAQIIIYTQMRDGMRQVSPSYFRSPQHQQELLKTFNSTLEQLEEELEEEEEEEEEKEEEGDD